MIGKMGFLRPLVPTDATESVSHVEALDEEAEAHDCGCCEDGTCDGGKTGPAAVGKRAAASPGSALG